MFQPTPSSRRETHPHKKERQKGPVSTHSLLAEGDQQSHADAVHDLVSTHSLLAEGDAVRRVFRLILVVSTHSLLAEGDALSIFVPPLIRSFQPTPSSRRET